MAKSDHLASTRRLNLFIYLNPAAAAVDRSLVPQTSYALLDRDIKFGIQFGSDGPKWDKSGTF